MFAPQFGETATILRPGEPGQDDYGNTVPGTTSQIVVKNCALAPGATNEQLQGQDLLTIDANLYMPPGTDVRADDDIEFRGVTYTIYGQPAVYHSPLTGHVGPVTVGLRKVG